MINCWRVTELDNGVPQRSSVLVGPLVIQYFLPSPFTPLSPRPPIVPSPEFRGGGRGCGSARAPPEASRWRQKAGNDGGAVIAATQQGTTAIEGVAEDSAECSSTVRGRRNVQTDAPEHVLWATKRTRTRGSQWS